MIVVDTNVVVRYAVKDDPEQTRLATAFLQDNRCLLLPTVILEMVWVLGSKRGYGLDSSTVAARIRHVAGLPTIEVGRSIEVAKALDWYKAGMDFADALHLALAGEAIGLANLDQAIRAAADFPKLQDRVMLISSETQGGG